MPGHIPRTPEICVSSSRIPDTENASTLTGIITSSDAAIAATLAAVKDGGQSMSTTSYAVASPEVLASSSMTSRKSRSLPAPTPLLTLAMSAVISDISDGTISTPSCAVQ